VCGGAHPRSNAAALICVWQARPRRLLRRARQPQRPQLGGDGGAQVHEEGAVEGRAIVDRVGKGGGAASHAVRRLDARRLDAVQLRNDGQRGNSVAVGCCDPPLIAPATDAPVAPAQRTHPSHPRSAGPSRTHATHAPVASAHCTPQSHSRSARPSRTHAVHAPVAPAQRAPQSHPRSARPTPQSHSRS
jgi:hypothetical protein